VRTASTIAARFLFQEEKNAKPELNNEFMGHRTVVVDALVDFSQPGSLQVWRVCGLLIDVVVSCCVLDAWGVGASVPPHCLNNFQGSQFARTPARGLRRSNGPVVVCRRPLHSTRKHSSGLKKRKCSSGQSRLDAAIA
jgi:hypothetical protein